MCGIAGIYHKQAPVEIEQMLRKIQHRGPNGQGIQHLVHGTVGYRHGPRRGTGDGSAPMGVAGAWIVFDGEIYNYRDLAREHLSDTTYEIHNATEVLIHLYLKYGPPFVRLLHGVFAIAIMKEDELFLVRDPLGLKPLYCGGQHGNFYFASEIKALSGLTKTIHEFPAGHWYHSQQGWKSYYEVHHGTFQINTETEAIAAMRKILREAVLLRLTANVRVGISLSGGLNSSIIAILARGEREQLHSFAVGMQGSDDLKAARKMAQVLRTQHHERTYTEADMLKVLRKVIYHLETFDPELIRLAIPNFFLAEMSSQHVNAIMTGDGADEVYAKNVDRSPYPEPKLSHETTNSTTALRNLRLQRADRIPMAFGLQIQLPFLDVRSIALGLALPEEWKFQSARPAKFLLRQAFAADLPEEIVNRPTQKFSVGAGSANVLAQVADREISDDEFQTEYKRLLARWDYSLPNKEALYYYRLFRENFSDSWIFPDLVKSLQL